jgi:hypothetical protein
MWSRDSRCRNRRGQLRGARLHRRGPGAKAIGSRIDALAWHCRAFGRPPESVLRTPTTYPLVIAASAAAVAEKVDRYVPRWVRDLSHDTLVAGTPAETVAHVARLIAVGWHSFIAFVSGHGVETVQLLAEDVIPALRRRQAAASAVVA